jgi:hypothetical protein
MPPGKFEKEMRSEVATIAKKLKITEERAFIWWYVSEAFRVDDVEASEAMSYDGGNDRGLDFFLVDDESERVVIGQSKYLKNSARHPKPADLTLLLNTINELEDVQGLRDAGRDDLAEAAEDLRKAVIEGYSVQLQFVYPGAQSEELDRLVRNFNKKNLRESLSASIGRLSDLELIHDDFKGAVGRVDTGYIDLPDGHFEHDGAFGKSLVASIPAASLKRLYLEHGNRLFDQNVRLFLGTRKGSVNAGIRETLEDPNERSSFWAYNNGITIVARSFGISKDGKRVDMTDFSVVNGCQTTVSIGEATDTAAKDVSVLARIVAANPNLVDSIIRFTNSQTPIKLWDLSARDALQKRLQKELKELPNPWFYALRRGELETLPNKDDFGPYGKRRLLEFPLAAQFVAAMRGLPVEAYKDKARLFTTLRDKVFPNDTTGADVLWAWAIAQASQRAIDQYKASLSPDETVSAILRRGARFFVVASCAHLLRLRNGDEVFSKVSVERLTDKAMIDRLNKYALISVSWYVGIMRGLVASGNDLGTLLRNSDTSALLEQQVKERLFEQEVAPKALDEALPRLPGIKK